VVINIGALKSGNYNTVRHERDKITSNESTLIVELILEVSYLDDEIVEGIKICYVLGVAFGKAT
jgi:deoxyribose-phosphate aldolase